MGSTYLPIQDNLWRQLDGETPSVITSSHQIFIMADGNIHQSRYLQKIWFELHDQVCCVDTYILKNTHFSFPFIASLDFLSPVLDVGQGKYWLRYEEWYTYYTFLQLLTPAGTTARYCQVHSLTAAKLNLYCALPSTDKLPKLISFTPEFTHWDSDDQEELLKVDLHLAWHHLKHPG